MPEVRPSPPADYGRYPSGFLSILITLHTVEVILVCSVYYSGEAWPEADTGDASKQSANERDGAMALAVGVCANESFKTGNFIDVASLNFPL